MIERRTTTIPAVALGMELIYAPVANLLMLPLLRDSRQKPAHAVIDDAVHIFVHVQGSRETRQDRIVVLRLQHFGHCRARHLLPCP